MKHLTLLLIAISLPVNAAELVAVTKITDGDTIKVNYKGNIESVRLIGIDTPESKRNKKAKKDAERTGQDLDTIIAMGKQATEYVKTLVKAGDKVSLEFDVQQRDHYGRLLCYIWLKDSTMLNEEIVKSDYANVMTIPPLT